MADLTRVMAKQFISTKLANWGLADTYKFRL
jgi:hypothetical protein